MFHRVQCVSSLTLTPSHPHTYMHTHRTQTYAHPHTLCLHTHVSHPHTLTPPISTLPLTCLHPPTLTPSLLPSLTLPLTCLHPLTLTQVPLQYTRRKHRQSFLHRCTERPPEGGAQRQFHDPPDI